MSALAEAVIAAFDSNTELTWTTSEAAPAIAHFEVSAIRVDVTFTETGIHEWRVGFDATSEASTLKNIHASIRVFSGVFQGVREFLEVRQPERLLFASKEEALGHLYEEYMKRQENPLRQIGYQMARPVKISPMAEFAIEKTTPSEWNEFSQ
jgi:hypothetical protein